MVALLNKLFQFVLFTTKKYGIDESHGLGHSMNVLQFAHKIYSDEVLSYPFLQTQEKIIYVSSILHDMCDKKYVNEEEGLKQISDYINDDFRPNELTIIKQIINTMSYSKIKKNGFPYLGYYQKSYHIVREADLLSAYDFDRSMIYKMNNFNYNLEEAFVESENLFNNRMFKHNQDGLFVTKYSQKQSIILESIAHNRINTWRKILYKNYR